MWDQEASSEAQGPERGEAGWGHWGSRGSQLSPWPQNLHQPGGGDSLSPETTEGKRNLVQGGWRGLVGRGLHSACSRPALGYRPRVLQQPEKGWGVEGCPLRRGAWRLGKGWAAGSQAQYLGPAPASQGTLQLGPINHCSIVICSRGGLISKLAPPPSPWQQQRCQATAAPAAAAQSSSLCRARSPPHWLPPLPGTAGAQ